MTNVELLLAVAGNFHWLGYFLTVIGVIYVFVWFCSLDSGESERKAIQGVWVPFIFGLLIGLSILSVPTIEDLWRVRIGLIKFQLASPENVQKSAETIERLGKKLECKYLGCPEEEKKEKTDGKSK